MNTDEALNSLKKSKDILDLYKSGYKSQTCHHCSGLGAINHSGKIFITCYQCNGRGILWQPPIKC